MRNLAFVCIALLSLLSLPPTAVSKLRGGAMRALSPTWKGMENVRLAAFTLAPKRRQEGSDSQALALQNTSQKQQIARLLEWVHSERALDRQRGHLKELLRWSENDLDGAYFQRRSRYLKDLILKSMQAVPAQVVFREPALWGTTLWINVGEKDNALLGLEVIAKDSPVVVGNSVVGVVEEVHKNQSRVRLITDHSIALSVRAVRGPEQDRHLALQMQQLVQSLKLREEQAGVSELIQQLTQVKDELITEGRSLYLAKGLLQGSSHPMFRGRSNTLKGVGFNYDFADEEGRAKELRTGADGRTMAPLLKIGDLLVTTGMDGIFPPDLLVGQVTAIASLKEGGASYDLEAHPVIPSFDEIREVLILPPRAS